jgi:hypothetical protein
MSRIIVAFVLLGAAPSAWAQAVAAGPPPDGIEVKSLKPGCT